MTCQGNTHGLANQINDGAAQTNESHIMPKGMETFIKLRAGGMGAAGTLSAAAGRRMISERMKGTPTVPAVPGNFY